MKDKEILNILKSALASGCSKASLVEKLTPKKEKEVERDPLASDTAMPLEEFVIRLNNLEDGCGDYWFENKSHSVDRIIDAFGEMIKPSSLIDLITWSNHRDHYDYRSISRNIIGSNEPISLTEEELIIRRLSRKGRLADKITDLIDEYSGEGLYGG